MNWHAQEEARAAYYRAGGDTTQVDFRRGDTEGSRAEEGVPPDSAGPPTSEPTKLMCHGAETERELLDKLFECALENDHPGIEREGGIEGMNERIASGWFTYEHYTMMWTKQLLDVNVVVDMPHRVCFFDDDSDEEKVRKVLYMALLIELNTPSSTRLDQEGVRGIRRNIELGRFSNEHYIKMFCKRLEDAGVAVVEGQEAIDADNKKRQKEFKERAKEEKKRVDAIEAGKTVTAAAEPASTPEAEPQPEPQPGGAGGGPVMNPMRTASAKSDAADEEAEAEAEPEPELAPAAKPAKKAEAAKKAADAAKAAKAAKAQAARAAQAPHTAQAAKRLAEQIATLEKKKLAAAKAEEYEQAAKYKKEIEMLKGATPTAVERESESESESESDSDSVSGKTSWPELVGLPGEEAVATISRQRPDLEVMQVPAGDHHNSPLWMTKEFKKDRVRVMINLDYQGGMGPRIGEVCMTPQIG